MSAPMERSSQSSFRARSWRPSSSVLSPARIAFSFECDAEMDGSKSSKPAPSLRKSPWSAWLGAPHDCALAALSSRRSRASCSASSAVGARRCGSPAELPPELDAAEPLAAAAATAASCEEPEPLAGASEAEEESRSDMTGCLRLRLEDAEAEFPLLLRALPCR